ncbi:hypothetical protein NIES4102_41270 (plasmid) [Chondrocystis sp. NIES-4102]|nr:hypothetical protein NIES4102_41270 [Chondrocystis sp. NIES-4102]
MNFKSLLLGLPLIDIIVKNFDNSEKLKFINGRQKLYTAINFIKGNLILSNLKTLTLLNAFTFNELLPARQKSFKRVYVKVIVIDPKSDLLIWKTRYY